MGKIKMIISNDGITFSKGKGKFTIPAVPVGWTKGMPRGPMPQEVKDKISKSLEGRHFSSATRKKMSEAKLGKPLPPTHKQNISVGLTGHDVNDRARENHSRGAKRMWLRNKK